MLDQECISKKNLIRRLGPVEHEPCGEAILGLDARGPYPGVALDPGGLGLRPPVLSLPPDETPEADTMAGKNKVVAPLMRPRKAGSGVLLEPG